MAGSSRTTSLEHQMNSMMAEIIRLQRDVADLNKEIASMKSKDQSVAFFSYLTNNIVNPSAGTRVTFRGVDVNTGSAYDATTGVFTAPVSGVYSFAFTASVPPETSDHDIHFVLKKNGRQEMYVFLDGHTQFWLQRSSNTVVHLEKGDTVWMEIPWVKGSNTVAGHENFEGVDQYHTHFSGFLIHAD